MTEQDATLTRHDLEAKIVKRCWQNDQFRKEFTADPVGAAVRYLEISAASLPKIVLHEEDPGSWHIVLPTKPANAGDLSEDDLEKVAGGVQITNLGTPALAVLSAGAVTLLASPSASATAAVTPTKGW
jgi:hypothetical protein